MAMGVPTRTIFRIAAEVLEAKELGLEKCKRSSTPFFSRGT
jgi:hypothetical protein